MNFKFLHMYLKGVIQSSFYTQNMYCLSLQLYTQFSFFYVDKENHSS